MCSLNFPDKAPQLYQVSVVKRPVFWVRLRGPLPRPDLRCDHFG